MIDCTDEADAVRTAELILSVNSASAAIAAFRAAAEQVSPGAVWADLNTAEPALERTLGSQAAARGITFADVSIMAPVPGRGLSTPMLASGTGARDVAKLLRKIRRNRHRAGRARRRRGRTEVAAQRLLQGHVRRGRRGPRRGPGAGTWTTG